MTHIKHVLWIPLFSFVFSNYSYLHGFNKWLLSEEPARVIIIKCILIIGLSLCFAFGLDYFRLFNANNAVTVHKLIIIKKALTD